MIVDETDVRLDRFLMRRFEALTFGEVQKLARKGQIRVNGGRVKPNHRLNAGDELRLPPFLRDGPREAEPADTGTAQPQREIAENIVFEDDELLILNKPAGLAVQGGSKTKRHVDGIMRLHFGDQADPKLVHRLDKDTSGLLAIAKNVRAAARLTEAFRTDNVSKTYLAIVAGETPEEGEIDEPLLRRAVGGGAEQMVVDPSGKPSVSKFKRLATSGDYSLLALTPVTGRTHQLRVHCAVIGHPILGDGKYGKPVKRAGPGGAEKMIRLCLHAAVLSLPDPATGRYHRFQAAPPAAFLQQVSRLGLNDGISASGGF